MTKQTESFLKKKVQEQAMVRFGNRTFALVAMDGDFCGLAHWQEVFKRNGKGPKEQVAAVDSEPSVWIHYTQLFIEKV